MRIRNRIASLALAMLSSASPALAFGWYLMVPPVRMTDNRATEFYYDLSQPLQTWVIRESFDTAFGCERQLDKKRANLERVLDRNHCADAGATDNVAADCAQTVNQYRAADAARCVASDDLRLTQPSQ